MLDPDRRQRAARGQDCTLGQRPIFEELQEFALHLIATVCEFIMAIPVFADGKLKAGGFKFKPELLKGLSDVANFCLSSHIRHENVTCMDQRRHKAKIRAM